MSQLHSYGNYYNETSAFTIYASASVSPRRAYLQYNLLKEQREAWHSDIKIFRYWKLQADQDTLKYIVEQVVDMMTNREDEFGSIKVNCTRFLPGPSCSLSNMV